MTVIATYRATDLHLSDDTIVARFDRKSGQGQDVILLPADTQGTYSLGADYALTFTIAEVGAEPVKVPQLVPQRTPLPQRSPNLIPVPGMGIPTPYPVPQNTPYPLPQRSPNLIPVPGMGVPQPYPVPQLVPQRTPGLDPALMEAMVRQQMMDEAAQAMALDAQRQSVAFYNDQRVRAIMMEEVRQQAAANAAALQTAYEQGMAAATTQPTPSFLAGQNPGPAQPNTAWPDQAAQPDYANPLEGTED